MRSPKPNVREKTPDRPWRRAGTRAAQIKQLGVQLDSIEHQRDVAMEQLPNVPHASVPVGKNSADNQEIHRHGEPTAFDFEPKPHWELGTALGIIDFERATKMSGARFSVLAGAGARLARALIGFMLDLHTREHGYVEVEPPFLVNAASLIGTGNLPKFEADLFKIAGEWDLYLIPTAEVPLTNMHRGEILDGRVLPIRYTAYTPCFRSEAGSYGQDVRGLIRQHQFDKVELVKLTTQEHSYDELEKLTENAEDGAETPRASVPESAALHRRHGVRVGQDVRHRGLAAEPEGLSRNLVLQQHGGLPGTARQHQVPVPAEAGKTEFVHTLNGSGLAVGRTLIAILENYQQKDGSIVIPTALRPYMDGRERIEKT